MKNHMENVGSKLDEIARKRLLDIKNGKEKGKTEKDLERYLKKRGIKI